MKRTTTIVAHTCDVCGKECAPVKRLQSTISSTPDFVNSVYIDVTVNLPYATANGDICKECLLPRLKDIIERMVTG